MHDMNIFNDFLTNYGFCRSKYDYCLCVRKDGLTVYILLFADDLLICCENEVIAEIKNKWRN